MIDFPDIKDAPEFQPPPDLGYGQPWWVWVAVLVGVRLLVWLIMRLWRKFVTDRPPPPPVGPEILALRMLDDLEGQSQGMDPRELGRRIVPIVRTWLHRGYGILANYRTPEEILALRPRADLPPPSPLLLGFQEFLLETNALGYGSQPTLSSREMLERARQLIRREIPKTPPVLPPVPPSASPSHLLSESATPPPLPPFPSVSGGSSSVSG